MAILVLIGPLSLDALVIWSVVGQAERSSLGVGGEGTSTISVFCGDEDFDGAESVDGQPVRVPQRFPALDRRDPRGLEKGANLLGVDFAARNKYALQVGIHMAAPGGLSGLSQPGCVDVHRALQTKLVASLLLPTPVYCATCGYGHSGRVM